MPSNPPRVLLVGENTSKRMGGEASLPYFYFQRLRERGVEAWLLTHVRVKEELRGLLPDDFDRIRFVEESGLDVLLWKLSKPLPAKIAEQTIGVIRHLLSQRRLRKLARLVVAEQSIDVVHETMPISPKAPSLLYDLGVPVVCGPLCGGMDYPPAFQGRQGTISRLVERSGRAISHLVNRLAPGRIRADALIVAHPQTRGALPAGVRGRIYDAVCESGVDMSIWGARSDRPPRPEDGTVRFAYLGRLVDWKAVDVLLDAFHLAVGRCEAARLQIFGDGPERAALEAQADRLGIKDRVEFFGWVTAAEGADRLKDADAFVLTSLRECGGTVLLEAMALGLPCIATNWGGPGQFVDDSTGIRVDPATIEGFVSGVADAMVKLAESPQLRESMGMAGRRRVSETVYSWDRKVDRVMEIYRETIEMRSLGRVSAQAVRP